MEPIELLLADATDLVLGSLLGPTWGVFLNGVPVIQPANSLVNTLTSSIIAPFSLTDLGLIAGAVGIPNIIPVAASTVQFEYGQDFPISNYQQEQGAFQSYNKITLPFDVKLRLACQGDTPTRQAFLQTCRAIAASIALFDVVTPEIVFTSVNCTHISWLRQAHNGATLIKVDLLFQLVAETGLQDFTSTQQPGDQAAQGLGNQQPFPPDQAVSSSFGPAGGLT